MAEAQVEVPMRILLSLALSAATLAGEDEWTRHELDGGVILAVQSDPLDASRLVAWGPSVVQYVSTDGGARWLPLQAPTPEGWDPHDFLLYFAGPGRLWRSSGSVLYYSTDWGRTWRHETAYEGRTIVGMTLGGDAKAEPLVFLAENPGQGRVLFHSARGLHDPAPVLLSTWTFKGDAAAPQLKCICAAPSDPDRIACLLGDRECKQTEIATTSDGGLHWKRAPQDLPLGFVQWDPRDKGALLATDSAFSEGEAHGLLRSTDGGASWTPSLPDLKGVRVRTLSAPRDGSRLYLVTYERGILVADEKGTTEANEGLGDTRCNALAVASDDTIVAGTRLGLFRSTDVARTWKWAGDGIANLQVSHMMFGKGGQIGLWDFTSGLRLSEDGGRRWTATPPPDGMRHVYEVHGAMGSLVALCEDGIRFSGDGKAWTPATGVQGKAESLAWVSPTEMYGIDGEGAAYRSDDGLKWAGCGRFPGDRKLESPFLCAREGTLVVGEASGFYRSSDKGATWTWKDFDARKEHWVSARIVGDSLLLLCPTKVLRADMASGSISVFYQMPDKRDAVAGVWVSPDDPKRCLLAGWPKHLMYTADGGSSWADLTGGLPCNIVFGPWVSPDGRAFVNAGGTVYSRRLPK